MDRLSNIVRDFNDRFGNVEWKDQDKIEKAIFEELPAKVAGNSAYKNAMANSDEQNARIEHDKALQHAITDYLSDPTELFKQFSDIESFRRWALRDGLRHHISQIAGCFQHLMTPSPPRAWAPCTRRCP